MGARGRKEGLFSKQRKRNIKRPAHNPSEKINVAKLCRSDVTASEEFSYSYVKSALRSPPVSSMSSVSLSP